MEEGTESQIIDTTESSIRAPPPYVEAKNSQGPAHSDILPPETLLLAGTTIHGGSSPSSPPLYRLSHAVGHLRASNTTVELFRFDYRVRDTAASATASAREKHIFSLLRPPPITGPSFEYHLESVSRSNLGQVGLRLHRPRSGFGRGFFGLSSTHASSSSASSSSSLNGYRAWRATRPREGANLEEKELVFVVHARERGRYEWRDGGEGQGRILAYETSEDGIYRLQIVETLERKWRDALVGTWCLRLWWEIAVSNVKPLAWEDVKRILQTRTHEFPAGTSAGL
ncbi:hypothetical protein SODALDRAFT_218458 [Sodiomyces alkalinus F11]|uniref:Uncharacterized protein n=1 Tax=Sodiomyces alkalinus (strain CBS 110278 / VKM F-3762 / F11) TaxID=1314773 RepID=A0A3N2PPD7_SODAK|nr:hypothetical protein SODALDRAFT_218458 [Sodiomyces alkalinus F11]ROT36378.1 hypothetical protein SODALDRAFT_218458 [Sodiomyces alkalinus F11]